MRSQWADRCFLRQLSYPLRPFSSRDRFLLLGLCLLKHGCSGRQFVGPLQNLLWILWQRTSAEYVEFNQY